MVDVGKYKEELTRLNNMYLKGRIDEKSYDNEYERIQKLILLHESDNNTQNSLDIGYLRQLFSSGWENTYKQLSRENKRKFWGEIIKEIHFNEDKTVKAVYFL